MLSVWALFMTFIFLCHSNHLNEPQICDQSCGTAPDLELRLNPTILKSGKSRHFKRPTRLPTKLGQGSDSQKDEEESSLQSSKEYKECKICGRTNYNASTAKVYNGTTVTDRDKYPWAVLIQIDTEKENIPFTCTGSLVSSKFVLTAGHCAFSDDDDMCTKNGHNKTCMFKPEQMKVVLENSVDITVQNSTSAPKRYAVKRTLVYPTYSDLDRISHDIALLELAKPMECNDRAAPICLPIEEKKSVDKVQITGYGKDELEQPDALNPGTINLRKLKEGRVNHVPEDECLEGENDDRDIRQFFCTTGSKTFQSTCKGDSGSGIFHKFEDGFYVLGVTSSGESDQCTDDEKNMDMNVHFFMPWIQKYIKDPPLSLPVHHKKKKMKQKKGRSETSTGIRINRARRN